MKPKIISLTIGTTYRELSHIELTHRITKETVWSDETILEEL